ncbi:MAG: sugar-transfer associated ATP-grasp domain-containing protein [Desulfatitalea sp.]
MLKSIQAFISNSAKAKAEFQTGLLPQILDLIRLRPNGVGISDYYKYKLYDPKIAGSMAVKKTYRGWRFKNELRHFSDRQIQGIAFHKHILYRLLTSFGLPVPHIFALYCPTPNGFERHRAMRAKTELERYLRETDQWPIFGKPSNASHGFGAIGIRARLEDGRFLLADETVVDLRELVDRIDTIAREVGTYMFCEFLQPSDFFKNICGSTLPSNRIVVLVRQGVPELYKALVLLPQTKRHVSNFQGGRNRSLSAGVDLESGTLFRVIDSDFNPMQHHPASGTKVEGLQLPEWSAAKTLILEAAMALSPFRMQHWDISYTTRGPVILEMNFIGDIDSMQMHGPPGLYTEQFKSFSETQKKW